jgi:hypothetical protein
LSTEIGNIPSAVQTCFYFFSKKLQQCREKGQNSRERKLAEPRMLATIATTRFNGATWKEWIDQSRVDGWFSYYSPRRVSSTITTKCIIVLELNNEKNMVMGIGVIRNIPIHDHVETFKRQWYNKVRYICGKRIDRAKLDVPIKLETGEEVCLVEYLDQVCFKGHSHCKRNCGITRFPSKFKVTPESLLALFSAHAYGGTRTHEPVGTRS